MSGNIRDYATMQQLIVLSDMESMNAELIKQGVAQSDRIFVLNKMAIEQLTSLNESRQIKSLESYNSKDGKT